jgi:alkylation response protein AidB-like acyl-CoA dehydrogenase
MSWQSKDSTSISSIEKVHSEALPSAQSGRSCAKSVRRFLGLKSRVDEVRRLTATETGFEHDVWDQMGDQLGLQGLAVPEEYGGSGTASLRNRSAWDHCERRSTAADAIAQCLGHFAWLG